jgi:hypothetical protein
VSVSLAVPVCCDLACCHCWYVLHSMSPTPQTVLFQLALLPPSPGDPWCAWCEACNFGLLPLLVCPPPQTDFLNTLLPPPPSCPSWPQVTPGVPGVKPVMLAADTVGMPPTPTPTPSPTHCDFLNTQ